MRQPTSCASCLLASVLVYSVFAEDTKEQAHNLTAELRRAVTAESDKAVSEFISSFPNVFQLRDAAKAFTNRYADAEAVAFLKKVAESTDVSRSGRAEQLAASIGLALLAHKQDTASFLKAGIGDDSTMRDSFTAIAFLPTQDARTIAESVALDGRQKYQTRIGYLFLLRAVGDKETLAKLDKIGRNKEPPAVWKVSYRTAAIIKQRLSLKNPAEQDRWAREELAFIQLGCWDPGFRSGRMGLAWSAEQMHRHEKDVSVDLLKARLSLERPRTFDFTDYRNMGAEIPIAAAVAAIQKNSELLPLLDEWAATDFGHVSAACREAADQLRGLNKD